MRKAIWAALLVVLSVLFSGCGALGIWPGNLASDPPPSVASGVVIRVLDIGQGDAVLIQTKEQTALVDTGDTTESKKLTEALKQAGVRRIDKLILTHPHRDHIGGVKAVFRNFEVRMAFDNGQPTSTSVYRKYLKTLRDKDIPSQSLRDGDVLDLGDGALLRVLSPTQEMVDERGMQDGRLNLNLNSLVARLEYGDFAMMLTGDAEIPTEEGIMARHPVGELRCQVLKAGHHGSKTASGEAFLRAVGAGTVLVSCGADNEYHCPHPSVLKRYEKLGIHCRRTDLSGTITVRTDGGSYTVETERGDQAHGGTEK